MHGQGATEEEIIEAAKSANAHNFILEQQDGYDTDVGTGCGGTYCVYDALWGAPAAGAARHAARQRDGAPDAPPERSSSCTPSNARAPPDACARSASTPRESRSLSSSCASALIHT